MQARKCLFSALIVAALAQTGCGAYATMEMPTSLRTPVTLGPVHRIGGGTTGHETTVANIDAEASDFAAATENRERVGNTEIVTRETTRITTTALGAYELVRARTEGKDDRDVRVDGFGVGAYAFIASGAAIVERWVKLNARVVEVRDAH